MTRWRLVDSRAVVFPRGLVADLDNGERITGLFVELVLGQRNRHRR